MILLDLAHDYTTNFFKYCHWPLLFTSLYTADFSSNSFVQSSCASCYLFNVPGKKGCGSYEYWSYLFLSQWALITKNFRLDMIGSTDQWSECIGALPLSSLIGNRLWQIHDYWFAHLDCDIDLLLMLNFINCNLPILIVWSAPKRFHLHRNSIAPAAMLCSYRELLRKNNFLFQFANVFEYDVLLSCTV